MNPTNPEVRRVKVTELSLHPLAHLVPETPADQYAALLADVEKRGQIEEPLKLEPGTMTVIDGRTRLKAATELGHEYVPVQDAVLYGDSAVVYMLRVSLLRRHVTEDQRAAMGAELLEQLKAQAKEKQKRGGETAGRGRPKEPEQAERESAQPVAAPPAKPARAPQSRDVAAKMVGVSRDKVTAAEQVKRAAPELHAKVKAGELKLKDAKKQLAPKDPPAKPPAAATTCVKCKAAFDSARTKCPSCGWVQPAETRENGARLMRIRNFPSDALAVLIAKGVYTVADLDAHVEKIRPKVKPVVPTRVTAMEDLGVARALALKAHDAIIDHQKPASEPAPAPAKKPDPDALCPCPFCGSTNVAVRWSHTGSRMQSKRPDFIMCQSCWATGPKPKNPNEKRVRKAWNNRAKGGPQK